MLDFLRRSGLWNPSALLQRALETEGLPLGLEADTLGVVELRGSYSGRKVTYFRIFDPKLVKARGVDVSRRLTCEDLNAHLDLVMQSGFIDDDGTVVFSRPSASDGVVPARGPADRASHTDDEQIVFPNRSN